MAKCVHKGCGKVFTDEAEPCVYHPGPPVFHEGQKGWKCCKPRVLTFDEFLSIEPCTTGKHSIVDDTPAPTKPSNGAAPANVHNENKPESENRKPLSFPTKLPTSTAAPAPNLAPSDTPKPPPEPPESDSDDPSTPIPDGKICKRKTCGVTSDKAKLADGNATCTYHPGSPVFHEGSKGWSCCKRRVLEFDEFMRIEGCKTRDRHCFVGKRRKASGLDGLTEELEKLSTVRHDFYQTASTVHASLYLKKVDKAKSKIAFDENALDLDLITSTGEQYAARVPLFAAIDTDKSTARVLGTKVELTLAKAEPSRGWPVLRADERATGEIIQAGKGGKA